jgi:hypothetical protein
LFVDEKEENEKNNNVEFHIAELTLPANVLACPLVVQLQAKSLQPGNVTEGAHGDYGCQTAAETATEFVILAPKVLGQQQILAERDHQC